MAEAKFQTLVESYMSVDNTTEYISIEQEWSKSVQPLTPEQIFRVVVTATTLTRGRHKETVLHKSAKNGDDHIHVFDCIYKPLVGMFETLKELFQDSAFSLSPLHSAAMNNDLILIHSILKPLKPNNQLWFLALTNSNGETPLEVAEKRGWATANHHLHEYRFSAYKAVFGRPEEEIGWLTSKESHFQSETCECDTQREEYDKAIKALQVKMEIHQKQIEQLQYQTNENRKYPTKFTYSINDGEQQNDSVEKQLDSANEQLQQHKRKESELLKAAEIHQKELQKLQHQLKEMEIREAELVQQVKMGEQRQHQIQSLEKQLKKVNDQLQVQKRIEEEMRKSYELEKVKYQQQIHLLHEELNGFS